MQCKGERAQQVAEQYLLRALSDFEAIEFEEHYFACSACFANLQALQLVRQEVARYPQAPPVKVLSFRRILYWGALAAAVTLVAFLVVIERQPRVTIAVRTPGSPPPTTSSQGTPILPAAEIAKLADLSLPPAEISELRGPSTETQFELGMSAYATGDRAVALQHFVRVHRDDPEATSALFYAAACEFALRDYDAARLRLENVAKAGDSPQYEASLYYLAQVFLVQGDGGTASDYLRRTAELRGDYEGRARAQLARIEMKSGQHQ